MRRDYRDWDAVMLWSGIGFILILWSTSILKALNRVIQKRAGPWPPPMLNSYWQKQPHFADPHS